MTRYVQCIACDYVGPRDAVERHATAMLQWSGRHGVAFHCTCGFRGTFAEVMEHAERNAKRQGHGVDLWTGVDE